MGTTVLWALVGLFFVVEVLLLLLVLQLLKQHGRLLRRVEQLERRPVHADDASAHAPLPAGLPVGAPVEPFRLASLDGETVSLENFHGRRVVLVNWHPACGYCDQIAGELAAPAARAASRRARGTACRHVPARRRSTRRRVSVNAQAERRCAVTTRAAGRARSASRAPAGRHARRDLHPAAQHNAARRERAA